MNISYCKKCHDCKKLKAYDDAIQDISKILNSDEISSNCVSYCGPGRTEIFAIVDDEIISDDEYNIFLEKLGELK